MTLYESVLGATLPWNSLDAQRKARIDVLPEQDIEICLSCRLRAEDCDRCDGKGNLATRGRPRKEIDTELLREMLRLKRCRKDICAALGIGKDTLNKAKKELLKEEMI